MSKSTGFQSASALASRRLAKRTGTPPPYRVSIRVRSREQTISFALPLANIIQVSIRVRSREQTIESFEHYVEQIQFQSASALASRR